MQELAFQRPYTEVWETLADKAEQCQDKFNLAYQKIQNKAKDEAEEAAAEALALLKTR